MRLVPIAHDNTDTLGVDHASGIIDVAAALASHPADDVPSTMDSAITGGERALSRLASYIEALPVSRGADYLRSADEVTFGPAVPNPEKIICVGLNYRKHAMESGMAFPTEPILFGKFNNSLSGHGSVVSVPDGTVEFDYEAELAIVIGKEGKNITEEDALDHVFGYASSNDLTMRELQFTSSQWLLGKNPDGFCPVGPYLVTRDDVSDPDDLSVRCFVNGELRQDSSTADMIFSCAEIISYASRSMTLKPGDIILTGTPEGVIMGKPESERVWLSSGDEIRVEIGHLGSLVNLVA